MSFVNTRIIISVVIILILLLIIKGIVGSIINLRENSHIVTKLKDDLDAQKRREKFLKEQLYYVKTNEFIEKQAREKLGLVKAGEHIVLAPPASSSPKEIVVIDTTPNWKKWWKLFF